MENLNRKNETGTVMKVSEIRKMTGLSQGKFADFFDVSVRTLQDWEQERRLPPPYVPGMMLRILEHEFFKKKTQTKKEITGGKKA